MPEMPKSHSERLRKERPKRRRKTRQELGYDKNWQSIRKFILDRDAYVCQHCGKPNSNQVDHIIPKAQGGTDDPENLQTICVSCHSKKTAHEDWLPSVPTTVICGPPASGKTTYVKKHMKHGDLVYDYDEIVKALTGLSDHDKPAGIHKFVEGIRREMMYQACHIRNTEAKPRHFWYITTETSKFKRKAIAQTLRAKVLVMERSVNDCALNLQRTGMSEQQQKARLKLVEKWWRNYERGEGEKVI